MKPWTDEEGIVHLGLYDFLLNEDLINVQVVYIKLWCEMDGVLLFELLSKQLVCSKNL